MIEAWFFSSYVTIFVDEEVTWGEPREERSDAGRDGGLKRETPARQTGMECPKKAEQFSVFLFHCEDCKQPTNDTNAFGPA